jgi:hypothetical protein
MDRYKSLTKVFSETASGLAETGRPGNVIVSTLSEGLDTDLNVTIFTITSARRHEV